MKPMKLISVAVLCLLPLAFAASPFTDGSIRKLSPDQATLGQEIVGELDLPDLARMMDAPRYSWDDLPLSDGSRVHVVLDAFSPFTPNARLMEMTDHGVIDHPIPSDRKYFKGTVAGTERGLALFILYEGGFKGFVDIGGDRHIYGTRIDPDTGRTVAACCLFDTLLAPPPSDWAGHWAGHTDMVETPFGDIVSVPSYTSPGPRVADRQANLAVEMDWESYSFFGTYQACVNYAADLAAGVTLVYEADIQTIIAICNIRVWTTSDDPYSSGGGIDASDLLDELRNEYLDNMGGSPARMRRCSRGEASAAGSHTSTPSAATTSDTPSSRSRETTPTPIRATTGTPPGGRTSWATPSGATTPIATGRATACPTGWTSATTPRAAATTARSRTRRWMKRHS